MRQKKPLKDSEIASLLAAVAVIAGFTLYWLLQIQAVLELLELAYG